MKFHIASPEDIKSGKTSDIYFFRTKEILEKEGVNPNVLAEFSMHRPKKEWPWIVFVGLDEVLELLEGVPVDLYALPEGTIVPPRDDRGVRIPVMYIEGLYGDFALYETPIIGFISQASGIATKAARIKKIAGEKQVLSFGIRRMHPAIAPMIDRAAYIGGCDAVSSIIGAEAVEMKPTGTMPHSLVLVMGKPEKAWIAFDRHMPPEVPRIALVDTLHDEKMEALMAARVLRDKLYGVRLDTPASRRGDMRDIALEVRWELDINGYKDVKIVISGGLDEEEVFRLRDVADAFGVGSAIANAPSVDFSMDIVEVDGKAMAKRGKMAGRKTVMRCQDCLRYYVFPSGEEGERCPSCGGELKPAMVKCLERGKRKVKEEKPKEIRERVLRQLERVSLDAYP